MWSGPQIDDEVGRHSPNGYAKAVDFLSDLKILAAERGPTADFDTRLAGIRERHAQKGRFIERLTAAGL